MKHGSADGPPDSFSDVGISNHFPRLASRAMSWRDGRGTTRSQQREGNPRESVSGHHASKDLTSLEPAFRETEPTLVPHTSFRQLKAQRAAGRDLRRSLDTLLLDERHFFRLDKLSCVDLVEIHAAGQVRRIEGQRVLACVQPLAQNRRHLLPHHVEYPYLHHPFFG